MIRNGLFEETNEQNIFCLKYFTINYILNLLYACIKPSMKNPFDALNSVTKSTSTILLVINIGHYEVRDIFIMFDFVSLENIKTRIA